VKRIVMVVTFFAFLAGIIFIHADMVSAAPKDNKPAANKDLKVEEKKEAKVVCKFKDADQMKEFEQLYIAKQAAFGRMSVLQAYFSLEQNNLQEIDKQMDKKFNLKMDPNKMYDLNRDTMEIREMGDIPKQASQAQ